MCCHPIAKKERKNRLTCGAPSCASLPLLFATHLQGGWEMVRGSDTPAARIAVALFCFLGATARLAPAENIDVTRSVGDVSQESCEPAANDAGYCGCENCFHDCSCQDVVLQSLCGHTDSGCWHPLTFSTLFSEGWDEPWVASPNGSGGAPRQGWINAADGNMYRLWFFTFAQGFNSGPQNDAYLGG